EFRRVLFRSCISAFDFRQGGHGGDCSVPAGGEAGGFVGKGQDGFQLFRGQGVKVLFAEFGEGCTEESIARAVGIPDGAGDDGNTSSLAAPAVKYAIWAKGDKDQSDTLFGKKGGAGLVVGGARQQRQLLIRDFEDIH